MKLKIPTQFEFLKQIRKSPIKPQIKHKNHKAYTRKKKNERIQRIDGDP